jgi:uncharacterized RDD family membrane protein YckC
MTCQSCQTWNTDDEHRCRRCGRLIQDMGGRAAARNYPIAAVATALQYEPVPQREEGAAPEPRASARPAVAQPALFETWPEPRVIPFDSLTSPRERRAIQERAAGLGQPPRTAPQTPERAESVRGRSNAEGGPPGPLNQSRPAYQSRPVSQSRPESRLASARTPRPRPLSQDQQAFHFADESEPVASPAPVIVCDDLAAPPAARLRAALVDLLCTAAAATLALAPIFIWARPLILDRWALAWTGSIVAAVAIVYPLIWIICGCGSMGARAARLTLVCFDGTRPSTAARYRRLLATVISVTAAGVGLLWALFDEDRLTWHDHMSGTFPTILNE